MGKMQKSPTEVTTTFFFDGDNVKLTYWGWKTTPNMSEAVFVGNDAKNDERLLFLSNDSEELMQNGIFPTCDKFDIKH